MLGITEWAKKRERTELVIVGILLIVMLFSLILSIPMSNVRVHASTIRKIDKQKDQAVALNVALTVTSTVVSAIPDDAGTPIAQELSDLSTPVMIASGVLYLEKYLLTMLYLVGFAILLPGFCLINAISILTRKPSLCKLANRFLVVFFAFVLLIPTSVAVTGKIEDTFSESIEATYNAVNGLVATEEDDEKEKGSAIANFFKNIVDNVEQTINLAKETLSVMIDAVVVLCITCCVIPLLTLLAFVWIVKMVLGSEIMGMCTMERMVTGIRSLNGCKRERLEHIHSHAKEK